MGQNDQWIKSLFNPFLNQVSYQDWELSIDRARTSDSGPYECQVYNLYTGFTTKDDDL